MAANRARLQRDRAVELGSTESVLAGIRTLREQANEAHSNTVDSRLRAALDDLIAHLDDQHGAIAAEYRELTEGEPA
jgi:hypothetical protein